jgi:para-aminobenzoate synthetase
MRIDFWIDRGAESFAGAATGIAAPTGDPFDWLDGKRGLVGYLGYERQSRWLTVERFDPAPPVAPAAPAGAGRAVRWEWARDEAQYRRDIAVALEKIRDGESYELCLTTQVRARVDVDPFALFCELRRRNPAPYASYLDFGDLAIVSASPERFVRVAPDGAIESRPIKGTRRRGATPVDDARLRRELAESAKDRAENLMIVDLVRSDLGMVCEIGSVDASVRFVVEEHPTVFQLVSTVRGRLRRDVAPWQGVRALHPGGSMTGAPKIRSMQILAALEGEPRGIYAGGIGFVGLDGEIDLAMAIRTLIVRPGEVSFGVGGAIVADSDPDAEIDELHAKAQAMIDAVAAVAR